MFGREVNKTAVEDAGSEAEQDLCTQADLEAHEVCGAGVAGSGPGEFSVSGANNLPLAVNASGDVWVGDSGRVEEFNEDGVFIEEVSLPGVGVVYALAVDALGDFYARSYTSEENGELVGVPGVREYSPSGVELGSPLDEAGHPQAIALDPATGDLFISDEAAPRREEATATLLEYDSSGTELESFASGEVLSNPVGDALAAGEDAGVPALYVLGPFASAQIFSPLPAVGVAKVVHGSTKAVEIQKTSATLEAGVIAEGAETTYHFEYVDDQDFKGEGGFSSPHTVKSAQSASIGEGFEALAASFEVPAGQLTPGTVYHFRVVASNTNGAGEEEATFETLAPARIDSSYATEVSSDSAVLDARVNPLGDATSYHFEYVAQSQFEEQGGFAHATSAPILEGNAGAGSEDVNVPGQLIQGLQADTVYRYRIVTHNQHEGIPYTISGPSETFTTQTPGSFALADGRAWEMVSPPDKRGALITPFGQEGVIQAALDGDAITYRANAATELEPAGSANQVQLLSTRAGDGWQTEDIAIPHTTPTSKTEGEGQGYPFFSEELTHALVQPSGAFIACESPQGAKQPCLSPEASEQTPFLRSDYLNGNLGEPCLPASMHCFTPLVTGKEPYANVPPHTVFGEGYGTSGFGPCPAVYGFCGPIFQDASPDATHVVISSHVQLTATPGTGLYEWTAGKLALVNVLPKDEGESVAGGAALGSLQTYQDMRGAVSADGSRVFWTVGSTGAGGHLYMRDTPRGETLRLDTPEPGCLAKGTCGKGKAEPEFQLASSNGSRVLFTDGQKLTSDSGAGSVEEGALGDLYECVIVETAGGLECELSDVAPSGSVRGVLGASEDGSWVYFVANGVLAPGAAPGGCVSKSETAAPGATCNLYVRHGGVTRLVAVLSAGDSLSWSTSLHELTARVSPDGEWVAFMSGRGLTGYDNRDALSGAPDEELYLYDARTGRLACASCDPSGARPDGVEAGFNGENMPLVGGGQGWEASSWLAADVPGWTSDTLSTALQQSRYLSDSGRLFFDGRDGLVPRDGNGVWDVYEYEPEGVGSCGPGAGSGSVVFKPARAVAVEGRGVQEGAGCVGLISSGESGEESAFLDASATGGRDAEGHEGGGDVFFLTTARLSPQDFDGSFDVYDAHECTTSSPCITAPTALPPCNTEASCKAAPTPQPSIFGSGPTETFVGPGNQAPAPPAKPKPPTAAQLRAKHLKTALAACRKRFPHSKTRRSTCEKQAKSKYGATKKSSNKKAKKKTK